MSTPTQPDTTMDVTKVPSRIKGGKIVAYSSAIHHTEGSHPIRVIAVHLPEAEEYAVWDLVYDQDRGRCFVMSGNYFHYGDYSPLSPSEALQDALERVGQRAKAETPRVFRQPA